MRGWIGRLLTWLPLIGCLGLLIRLVPENSDVLSEFFFWFTVAWVAGPYLVLILGGVFLLATIAPSEPRTRDRFWALAILLQPMLGYSVLCWVVFVAEGRVSPVIMGTFWALLLVGPVLLQLWVLCIARDPAFAGDRTAVLIPALLALIPSVLTAAWITYNILFQWHVFGDTLRRSELEGPARIIVPLAFAQLPLVALILGDLIARPRGLIPGGSALGARWSVVLTLLPYAIAWPAVLLLGLRDPDVAPVLRPYAWAMALLGPSLWVWQLLTDAARRRVHIQMLVIAIISVPAIGLLGILVWMLTT
ncbi:MAG: hypothetical protein R3F30_12255 [Planctomycetota bacterium]